MRTFAEMVDEGARQAGLNDYQLSHAIGLLPGRKVVNAKQVGRLRRGEQRHYSPELVARLIEILPALRDEDGKEEEAWKASGTMPPWVDVAGLRRLRMVANGPRAGSNPIRHKEWHRSGAAPLRRVLEPLVAVAA